MPSESTASPASLRSEKIVRDCFGLILTGDVENAFEHYLSFDFVWENPLPEIIPFGGRFEGPVGLTKYARLLAASIEMEAFSIGEIIATPDRVVVVGQEVSLVRATGRRYEMDWVHVLKLREGRVHHWREFNDTAAMVPAFASLRD